MKARLVPLYFRSGRDEDYEKQLKIVHELLGNEAEILEPIQLGSRIPKVDAVIFPQLLGDAYQEVEAIRAINVPILVVTSEFGTMMMWDWEIGSFLKSEGIDVLLPYNLSQARRICKSLAVKRDLKQTKFLMYQDNPGEGFQAPIFKRFFWWEDRCIELLHQKFGVTIEYRSFKEFGAQAKAIPDKAAEEAWKDQDLNTKGLTSNNLNSAMKIYLAAKQAIQDDPNIKGIGINCLNESHFSDTTPCVAWPMLFEELGTVWACEADIMSLMTKYLAHHCVGAPIMMTNIYPFLMGDAALRHEHIESFPDVDEPDNCILLAHCGYLGIVPKSQATEWTLRPKVLAIVDENAHALDARLPLGPMTMTKLDPTLSKLMVVPCNLEQYVQYPGSHCLNGAVIRVPDGHKVMTRAYSHHQCFLTGKWQPDLEFMCKVFALDIEEID